MNLSSRLTALAVGIAVVGFFSISAYGQSDHDPENQATVAAQRGGHATILFAVEQPVELDLQGRLLDLEDHPLEKTAIRVVRFEVEGPDDLYSRSKPVPLDELNQELAPFSIKQRLSVMTGADGRFSLSALAPGRYSLQVDWEKVPKDVGVVQLDLRWVQRPLARGRGQIPST